MGRQVLICLAVLLGWPGLVAGQPDRAGSLDTLSVTLGEVVVLPLANYTGRHEAMESVLPVIYEELHRLGLPVMSHEELRPILRRHRVRMVGQMSRTGMDLLRTETGARHAVVGSIDIYEPGQTFELLLSLRVVELSSHRVVRAVSIGRVVQETEEVFGRNRAEEIGVIVDEVIQDFMDEIGPVLAGGASTEPSHHSCGLVAVVPLDDYSQRRHGADVLQNLLLSELSAGGWDVVEPGVIAEVLLDRQIVARGGVSDEVVTLLRSAVGVCSVVVGELETFALAPTGSLNVAPRLGFGLRLVDAREARLVSSIDVFRDGSEGETLFGRGREYSMYRLAKATMKDVVSWIDDEEGQ